jgi:hypothetical protein
LRRIAQTWELISESFAVLKSDKALIFLPVFSGLFCLLVSISILGGAGMIFLPPNFALADTHRQPMSQGMWITLLLFYLGNYFVIAFFNVALVAPLPTGLPVDGHRSTTGWKWPGNAKARFSNGHCSRLRLGLSSE